MKIEKVWRVSFLIGCRHRVYQVKERRNELNSSNGLEYAVDSGLVV